MSQGPQNARGPRGRGVILALLLFAVWIVGVHAGFVWWHRARIAEVVESLRP